MAHMRPLAIDLFTGLHGWGEALAAEGFDVIGFDLEDVCAQFGLPRGPHIQLVLQDVLTLHGSQFRDADLIVASPPCQFFSYTAMPWKRAKALAAEVRADPVRMAKELALFNACFRIQREACEAAGRHVPMVVENVRGAIPWVGRSRWNCGSYHLWGDVPALMPPATATKVPSFRFDGSGQSFQSASVKTVSHPNIRDGHSHMRHLTDPAEHGVKQGGAGRAWFDKALDERRKHPDGTKNGGDWFGVGDDRSVMRQYHSGSTKRKAASAMIAKIPEPLARHIAAVFRPSVARAA